MVGSMKVVAYAGQQFVTTDDVAGALLQLAAAIAREGSAEALRIPVVLDGVEDCADLIVGAGIGMLVESQLSAEPDPDFSEHAASLTRHRLYPKAIYELAPPFQAWSPVEDYELSSQG